MHPAAFVSHSGRQARFAAPCLRSPSLHLVEEYPREVTPRRFNAHRGRVGALVRYHQEVELGFADRADANWAVERQFLAT
jgi:hypothetical protein